MTHAPPLDLLPLPDGHCPKCIGPRKPSATSCPFCGLVFSNMKGSEYELPAGIRDAWTALLPNWEDPRAHRTFVQAAHAMGELAAAGRLYRRHLARCAEDERALGGIQEILRLALLPCERPPSTSDAADRLRTRRRAAFAGALLLCGMGSLLVFRILIGSGVH